MGPRGIAPDVFSSQDSMLHSSRQQLEDALSFEMEETHRLNTAMKDLKLRFDKGLAVQSKLEHDVAERDDQIAKLQNELKELRKQTHAVESDLAQLTMEHINAQTKWLDQTSLLNEEITQLKREKRVASAKHQAEELAWADAAAAAVAKADELAPPKKSQMILPTPTESMEHHAQTLLVNELRLRLENLKEEINEVREVNSRLEEENEGFQLLLAEKTIDGGMSLADELASDNEETVGEDTIEANGETIQDEIKDETYREQLKELKQLKFETKSLQNHNKALRMSLERLVCRLLESEKFAKTIEESVPARKIGAFSTRVASYSGDSTSPQGRATRLSRGSTASTPAQWTSMLFNYHLSGNTGRRVLTLGVDDVVPEPPTPEPQTRSASRSSRSSGFSFSSQADEDGTIELPKRTSRGSQTKMRRLQMSG